MGVGQAQTLRSAKIPLTESPTDKLYWPVPFGSAVTKGKSLQGADRRENNLLFGGGREALLSKWMKSGQHLQVDEPRKPQLHSFRGFYSETWLSAQIMEVPEPELEEVLAWIK